MINVALRKIYVSIPIVTVYLTSSELVLNCIVGCFALQSVNRPCVVENLSFGCFIIMIVWLPINAHYNYVQKCAIVTFLYIAIMCIISNW